MADVINSIFNGGTVQLDGQRFEGCTFVNATLVFSAKAPVSMHRCVFQNVQWVLDGAAALTVNFLRALYHGAGEGGRQVVEAMFQQLRTPPEGNNPPGDQGPAAPPAQAPNPVVG